MRTSAFLLGCTATLTAAYTQPKSDPTWGALLTPNIKTPVTQGQDFNITWDPNYGGVTRETDNVFVSLVLCRGNSNSCKPDPEAIADLIPAGQKSYNWKVPCDLPAGTQLTDTGYGMLIIVNGTGDFQYSTQFSVLEGQGCAAGGCKA